MNVKLKKLEVMKQLVVFCLLLLVVLIFASCKDDDVKPSTIMLADDLKKSLVQSLELFYYGESINIWEESKRIVGVDGGVEYEIYQPQNYDDTDYVHVTFNLNGDAYADFNNLNFKLKVDMSKQSVEDIEEALLDGEYLSATNLILVLGDW